MDIGKLDQMNSVYSLIYIIFKNYCSSLGCANCKYCNTILKNKYLCELDGLSNPIDKLLKLLPPKPHTTTKHPLWDVFMRECNNHYIYGRFDCCSGCKFKDSNTNTCVFKNMWENMKRC